MLTLLVELRFTLSESTDYNLIYSLCTTITLYVVEKYLVYPRPRVVRTYVIRRMITCLPQARPDYATN
jgi:hypothetical protein